MPVNLTAPDASALHPVAGVTLGIAKANIRKPDRKDLLVIALDPASRVAGVFTQNKFCAAPVTVAREHLDLTQGAVRALVVNTGNANAGTGATGLEHARLTCRSLAGLLGVQTTEVLPFSTGVIMEPLPVERITQHLPDCVRDLAAAHWREAAEAIMTTDIVPKAASKQVTIDGATVTITGIAKGSGMIHPNMATMLGFIATDARISQELLDVALREAVNQSFNCITVDGDTSTNDACVLIATQQADMPEMTGRLSGHFDTFVAAVTEVARTLAQAIVRDGEGATKFMTIQVDGGRSVEECRQVAFAIAHSPLVKTAFFASDPNLGRILAAIGYAGVDDLDVNRVRLYLDDVLVAENGGRNPAYREEDGNRVMQQPEITVRVDLGRGPASATVWTCDFSHDYVRINAEYRS